MHTLAGKSGGLKVCLVKQHSCYDLYKVSGKEVRPLIDSSNWRSGPIGLWEAFDCDFRIVYASTDPECRVGEKLWKRYVQGWDIWPEGHEAEHSSEIDWTRYDVVVAIDVAVPTRIVRNFPQVMWCYYFIEGGPRGIDTLFKGSPFYGYNLFFNHRLPKTKLSPDSVEYRQMHRTRRAVLDFPYYMQSSKSIRKLYPELANIRNRNGIALAHHSYPLLTQNQRRALSAFGTILEDYQTISDIHKIEIQSKYYIMHPEGPAKAGLGMIEAISAGCLALSPARLLWGFPELVHPSVDFNNFNELLALLEKLESEPGFFHENIMRQAEMVDRWCYYFPSRNFLELYQSFRNSPCAVWKQNISERLSYIATYPHRTMALIRQELKFRFRNRL